MPVAPPTSGGILDSLKKADEQQQQTRRRRQGRRRRVRNKAGRPCRNIGSFPASEISIKTLLILQFYLTHSPRDGRRLVLGESGRWP